jgi:hypothetical protein
LPRECGTPLHRQSERSIVYIEALDGEDFTVVIDLIKDFDYMGLKGFRIVCEIAGSKDQRVGYTFVHQKQKRTAGTM